MCHTLLWVWVCLQPYNLKRQKDKQTKRQNVKNTHCTLCHPEPAITNWWQMQSPGNPINRWATVIVYCTLRKKWVGTSGANWKPIQATTFPTRPVSNWKRHCECDKHNCDKCRGEKSKLCNISFSLLAIPRPALFVAEAELTKWLRQRVPAAAFLETCLTSHPQQQLEPARPLPGSEPKSWTCNKVSRQKKPESMRVLHSALLAATTQGLCLCTPHFLSVHDCHKRNLCQAFYRSQL